jgi:hypothetical protein
MTPRIAELFAKKAQLFTHIIRIDEMIKLEVESTGNFGVPAAANSSDKDSAKRQSVSLLLDSVESNASQDYTRLTWTKKLLHHLRLANHRGMTTTELTKALKDYHQGEWKKPSVSLLLNAMDKNGKIRVDRSLGRNRYYSLHAAKQNA